MDTYAVKLGAAIFVVDAPNAREARDLGRDMYVENYGNHAVPIATATLKEVTTK